MGESFLNELIYVLGAGANEPRQLPFNREVLVYTSNENDSDNYRTYLNAVNTGTTCPVHNFKLCQRLALRRTRLPADIQPEQSPWHFSSQ